MGFLDWGRQPDPLVGLVEKMVTQQQEQQKALLALVGQVLEVQKDQNQTTRQLLEQYLATGSNQATSLDDRLFSRESEEATGWDPVLDDPFASVGL